MTEQRSGPATDGSPEDGEIEELLDDLEDLEETADSRREQRVLRRTIGRLSRASRGRIFGVDDVAQQIVGGFILSAAGMTWLQWIITVFMVFAIGYGTLYRADDDRDAEREESIGGLPLRFVSLLVISYSSVAILAFVFAAPATFDATATTTVKAISIGAIFSVVGAATADSLF